LDPQHDDELLVKSVYLSTGRFNDAKLQDAYRAELEVFSQQIRTGHRIEFDSAELARLAAQKDLVRSISFWRVVWTVVWMFWPHLLIVSIFLFALWALRHLPL
jgi:hypothetical protein